MYLIALLIPNLKTKKRRLGEGAFLASVYIFIQTEKGIIIWGDFNLE